VSPIAVANTAARLTCTTVSLSSRAESMRIATPPRYTACSQRMEGK
jgi:hypothetical protein